MPTVMRKITLDTVCYKYYYWIDKNFMNEIPTNLYDKWDTIQYVIAWLLHNYNFPWIHCVTQNGNTSLQLAIRNGHIDVCKCLITDGNAKCDEKDKVRYFMNIIIGLIRISLMKYQIICIMRYYSVCYCLVVSWAYGWMRITNNSVP